jgi:hypothetical protein
MKTHRWAITIMIVNFVFLLFSLVIFMTQAKPMVAKGVEPVLRANALELVGEDGKIRARINVESDGEVVFRLTDEKGNIRVKLGASEDGSGFVLLNDSTEPGVQLLTQSTGTTLTLTSKEGQQRVIVP